MSRQNRGYRAVQRRIAYQQGIRAAETQCREKRYAIFQRVTLPNGRRGDVYPHTPAAMHAYMRGYNVAAQQAVAAGTWWND